MRRLYLRVILVQAVTLLGLWLLQSLFGLGAASGFVPGAG